MQQSSPRAADPRSASSAGTEQSRAARAARGFPGWIWAALALTALHLATLLVTGRPTVRLASVPTGTPAPTPVLSQTEGLDPIARATPAPPPTPTSTAAPPPSNTPFSPASGTSTTGITPAASQTPTAPPSPAATRSSGSTPTPTARLTPTSTAPIAATRASRPFHTPAPTATHTATADDGQVAYVPAALEETSLGQAVINYNTTHPQKMTLHVVGRDSQGVDRAMYQDLVARQWRIMGPEDFAQSTSKPGWPYLVIALQDTLDANSVAGWRYVLDHEWVHMVAAANLATAGLNLAELMRGPDGRFSHQARFHEVCADYYPRDQNGEHRPVAAFYGALQRMPELLRVLSALDPPALAYQPPPEYQIPAITGLPLVDAACVWDRAAMQAVRRLYDQRQGPGAFDLLFPGY